MQKTIRSSKYFKINSVSRKETTRRVIVRMVMFIYWLLIFTGPLRKWGIPGAQTVLFFLRLPVIVLLYFFTFQKHVWPHANTPLIMDYLLGVASAFLVPLQLLIGNYDYEYLFLSTYGWLNYFFYAPLVFIIANNFKHEDVLRLLKLTLIFIILEAPLVILQFSSSPSSVFNTGSSMDIENQFISMGAEMGRIRPTGFFSSASGQALFLSVSTIAVLFGWINPHCTHIINRPILLASTFSLFIATALSGSRGAVAWVAIIIVFTVFSSFVIGKRRLEGKVVVLPLILVVSFVFLWPIIFPTGYDVFITRWGEAYRAESSEFTLSFFGRALYSFYGWIYYLDLPITGFLLGVANNASSRLSWVNLPSAANTWEGYGSWATESTWGVHLVELGILLGMLYIFYRIYFTLWTFKKSWSGTRKKHDPLALMIFSFAGLQLLIGTITVQGDSSGFVWLFLGLCLASSNTDYYVCE